MIPNSNIFSWVNNDQDKDDESAFQLIGKLYYFQGLFSRYQQFGKRSTIRTFIELEVFTKQIER